MEMKMLVLQMMLIVILSIQAVKSEDVMESTVVQEDEMTSPNDNYYDNMDNEEDLWDNELKEDIDDDADFPARQINDGWLSNIVKKVKNAFR